MLRRHIQLITLPGVIIVLLCNAALAQDAGGFTNKALQFPDRLFKKVDDKVDGINKKLVSRMEKYLQRRAKREKQLKKKLAATDSAAAARLFNDAEGQYALYQRTLRKPFKAASNLRNKYIPHLDTLKTAFAFLAKTGGLIKGRPQIPSGLSATISKTEILQQNFNRAEDITKYINQRRQFLYEQLGKFGLAKEIKKLQKEVHYYQAWVEEYQRMLSDPSKMEAKAIDLLKHNSLFRDFFNEHAELAGLFRLPGNSSGNSLVSLAGLQTRDAIQQELVQRFGSGAGVQQIMQQQVSGAQNQILQLKEKVNAMSFPFKGEQEGTMPDFKPNNQKTKRFKDRLELGTNLQTVRSNRFFPSTSDFGLSLGYKLNEKSIIGIGSSYKLGWGKSIRHITVTHEGIGLRSFADYKIKRNLWFSGGAELNYRSRFDNFDILKDYSAWQKSALLGVSKKYKVSSKLKGNMQVMYDFLWKQQVPRTQAVVFRIGYHF